MVSVPSRTPLARKRTLAIVPVLAVAVAVRVVVPPVAAAAPVAGELILTVGAVPEETTMATAAEVVWLPRLSVATAWRV